MKIVLPFPGAHPQADPQRVVELQQIAAKVREKYAVPPTVERTSYAYQLGVASVDLAQLHDALERYGQHAGYCRVREIAEDARCSCGLDQALTIGTDLIDQLRSGR